METLTCPDCGSPMTLRDSRYGKFYGCTQFPKCKGTHGAHPDGRPLGTPADRETKLARINAHDAFDLLWKIEPPHIPAVRRSEAYVLMQFLMGMTPAEAHIGNFSKEQCERLIAKLSDVDALAEAFKHLAENPPKPSPSRKRKRKEHWRKLKDGTKQKKAKKRAKLEAAQAEESA